MSIEPNICDKNSPYSFISYSSKDKDRISPILEHLQKNGYLFWYDQYIKAGESWPDSIADALTHENCVNCLIFLSRNSLASENVSDEIHLARDNNKKCIVVYLEDVKITSGLKLRLGRRQNIKMYELSEEQFLRKLMNALSKEKSAVIPKSDTSASIETKEVSSINKRRNFLNIAIILLLMMLMVNVLETVYNRMNLQTFEYIGNSQPVYPTTESDFVELSNDKYFFSYPKNFFYKGYYDSKNRCFFFKTRDDTLTMTLTEKEAPFEHNPVSSANYLAEQKKNEIVEDSKVEERYMVLAKATNDKGYAQSIISGQLVEDSTKGTYILYVCDNSRVYTLTFDYRLDTSISTGYGIQFEPLGYIIDSVYRSWSIANSTYKIRSLEEYNLDIMGEKAVDLNP